MSRPLFDPERVRAALDRAVIGLDAAKRRLVERVALTASSPEMRGPPILLTGPGGSGKDALVAALGEGLGARVPRIDLDLALDVGAVSIAASLAVRQAREEPLVLVTALHRSVLLPGSSHDFETIPLSSYGRVEKREIALRALLPGAKAAAGPAAESIELAPAALDALVERGSQEPGVHGLVQAMGLLVRRIAARKALGKAAPVLVSRADIETLLGPPPPPPRALARESATDVGVAVGLIAPADGGACALVEALCGPRAGPISGLSAALETAAAFVHAHAGELRIEPDALASGNIRVRASGPDGGLPGGEAADGLDLAALLALVSLATDRPVRADTAAAGNLTLRGQVVSADGIAERVLAADRAGFRRVLVARDDFATVEATVSPNVLAGLEVVPVASARDAVRAALIDVVIAREIR